VSQVSDQKKEIGSTTGMKDSADLNTAAGQKLKHRCENIVPKRMLEMEAAIANVCPLVLWCSGCVLPASPLASESECVRGSECAQWDDGERESVCVCVCVCVCLCLCVCVCCMYEDTSVYVDIFLQPVLKCDFRFPCIVARL
jgi:Mevalonate 5-diphosphate decarboxylase C-terminal domain